MKRREIIKYTAWATGATLGVPLISSIMAGCKADQIGSSESYSLKIFDQKSFDLVQTLVDIIMPKSDSPSASEVGVHRMIDHMVATIYDDAEQKDYMGKFKNFGIHLSTMDFFNKSESDQLGILKSIQKYEDKGLMDIKDGFNALRQQTIAYYLSTEEISTKFLNYLPVPGGWEPCTPVSEVGGKAWAI